MMFNGLSVAEMIGIAAASLTAAGRMSRAMLIEPETGHTPYWAEEYSRHIELFEAMASNLSGRGVSAKTLRAAIRAEIGHEAGVDVDRPAVLEAERALLVRLERVQATPGLEEGMGRYLRLAAAHVRAFVGFLEQQLARTPRRPAVRSAELPARRPGEPDDVVYHFSGRAGA